MLIINYYFYSIKKMEKTAMLPSYLLSLSLSFSLPIPFVSPPTRTSSARNPSETHRFLVYRRLSGLPFPRRRDPSSSSRRDPSSLPCPPKPTRCLN